MSKGSRNFQFVTIVLCLGIGYFALSPVHLPNAVIAAETARTATSTEISITGPRRLYTADFNNDTYPDLVVDQAVGTSRFATVFISNGSGGYVAPNQIALPLVNGFAADFRIVAKDFTNDGKVDMAIYCLGMPGGAGGNNGSLKFLQGDGMGGFGPLITIGGGLGGPTFNPYLNGVAPGDVNGDGKLDLIFSYRGPGMVPGGNVSWSYGDGTGNFGGLTAVGVNMSAVALVAGDFTNDGKSDVVVQSTGWACPDPSCTGSLQALVGDGAGHFAKIDSASVGATSMTTGDFNNDGKLDVFSGNGIVLGDGAGGLTRSATIPGVATGPYTTAFSPVVGDLDHDGKLDGALILQDGKVGLYFGDGSGGILSSKVFNPGIGANGLAVADFNHNGSPDLAVSLTDENKIVIYYDGVVANLESRPVFDIDGDGKTDIAVYRPGDPGVWYYIRSSTNTFQAFYYGTIGDVPVAADYSGDGKIDFAVWRPSTGVWYRALPSGTAAMGYGLSSDTPIVGGDYDGDGSADIAVYRVTDGIGTFYINTIGAVNLGTDGDKPLVGDFDGDGKTDVAVYHPGSGPTRDSSWSIIRSSDHGMTSLTYGIGEDLPVVADFNGDHLSNIAVFRPSTGYWYTTQDPSTNYGGQQFGSAGDVPMTGDYDGDGKIDFGVYRTGVWYILTSNSRALVAYNFGVATDKPVPAMSLPQ